MNLNLNKLTKNSRLKKNHLLIYHSKPNNKPNRINFYLNGYNKVQNFLNLLERGIINDAVKRLKS